MVRKNCRSRKIENASKKKYGTISGTSVPVSPSRTHRSYSGTIVTCGGSIIATTVIMKNTFCPRHRSRDSA